MADLVARNYCGEDLVHRFEAAGSQMSARQRELLNLTEDDVYAFAPGVLGIALSSITGPFQLIRPLLRNKVPHITYTLLCCAFYKKQMLFDAVKDVPLIEDGSKPEFLPMPDGNRAPLRQQSRYPSDQKAFSLTRDSSETASKYQNGLCFKEENSLVLTEYKNSDMWTNAVAYLKWLKTKIVVLGAEPSLSMTSDDLVKGGRRVFRVILDAVVGRKVETLAPLVLGSSVLDVHRKFAWELKDTQRSALMVTDSDFVGFNGFVYNWDGFGSERGSLARMIHSANIVPRDAVGNTLEAPYFKYTIILAALLRKNELYKMCRGPIHAMQKDAVFCEVVESFLSMNPSKRRPESEIEILDAMESECVEYQNSNPRMRRRGGSLSTRNRTAPRDRTIRTPLVVRVSQIRAHRAPHPPRRPVGSLEFNV
ncbi:unnamed protein product [Nippostrongylus brasiliensis]|uniref:Uncharacterized protein n=1 Tax=Nippostrongylus brasiliensis TaxID=27835 RepID=A0A0N4YDQ7_NIPBR|nr:unnamed protein product [Nippostrongylus brasiliensis]